MTNINTMLSIHRIYYCTLPTTIMFKTQTNFWDAFQVKFFKNAILSSPYKENPIVDTVNSTVEKKKLQLNYYGSNRTYND